MKQVWVLAGLEIVRARRWLGERMVSKIAVVLVSLVVGGGIAWGLAAMGWTFFRYLKGYEEYGVLTAEYIIRAAVLVMMWLGIVLAAIAAGVWWWRKGAEAEYLLSLPLVGQPVVVMMAKGWLANSVLLALVVAPLALMFVRVFGGEWGVGRVVMVVILLAGWAQAWGAWLGWKMATGSVWVRWVGIGLGIVMSAAIVRIIWPVALGSIYDVEAMEFGERLRALPIFNEWLVSNWWADWVVGSGMTLGVAVGLTLVLVGASSWLQQRGWIEGRLKAMGRKRTMVGGEMEKFEDWAWMRKEVMSVTRSWSEKIYAVGLGLMALVFVGLLGLGVTNNPRWLGQWGRQTTAVVVVWMLFFVTAYCLRLVFPLMAKEGRVLWWLETLPKSKGWLWVRKLGAGGLLALPIVILVSLLWGGLRLGVGRQMELMAVTLIGGVGVAMINGIWGMIKPAYNLGDFPEEVTTTPTGWMSVVMSLLWIGLVGVWVYFR